MKATSLEPSEKDVQFDEKAGKCQMRDGRDNLERIRRRGVLWWWLSLWSISVRLDLEMGRH